MRAGSVGLRVPRKAMASRPLLSSRVRLRPYPDSTSLRSVEETDAQLRRREGAGWVLEKFGLIWYDVVDDAMIYGCSRERSASLRKSI